MKIKNHQGFTLAELLVVISIIGILTTIVLANFQRGNYANDLRRTGTELLQDFRLAQNYTIGGSSLDYCTYDAISSGDYGKYCTADNECNSGAGVCRNGVPLGGYGLHFESTELYSLFADTDNDQALGGNDREIIVRNPFLKSIRVSQFQLGTLPAIDPQATQQYLDVLFYPPDGQIHFFVKLSGAPQVAESLETTARILLFSDRITSSCRQISINRISGQISEVQGGCSL